MARFETMVHQVSSVAPGTGDVALPATAASAGRRTFLDAIGNGNECYYFLENQAGSEWGLGTITGSVTATLSRDSVIGNSFGTTAKMNFTGVVNVWSDIPAEKRLTVDNTSVFGRARLTDANAAAARAALVLSSADDVTFNRVRNVALPAFFALGTLSVQTGPNIYIDFQAPQVNVGGHWSAVNKNFTCPLAGLYRVDFHTLTNGNVADTWIMLLKNGVSMADGYSSPGAAPNQFLSLSASAIMNCAANDIIAFFLKTGIVYQSPYTHASITFLG